MSQPSDFVDQVILINGGTSGIGLATAALFAKQNPRAIIVTGRRASKWQTAQTYLQKILSTHEIALIHYWPCDVRVEQQVKAVIAKIFDEFGRLDVCFNNAGVQPGVVTGADSGFIGDLQFESTTDQDGAIVFRVPPPQPTSGSEFTLDACHPSQTTPASEFCESEIATSCIGLFNCLKWQIKYIFERQPKELPVAIINTSSRNGVLPDAHRPLYAASKAFILSLTKSTSNQVAQKSIKDGRQMVRINAISPGPIDTPLEFGAYGTNADDPKAYQSYAKAATIGVPMHRTGQPEEIAPTVLFLANNKTASYITGANICVDGGHTGSPLLCACEIN